MVHQMTSTENSEVPPSASFSPIPIDNSSKVGGISSSPDMQIASFPLLAPIVRLAGLPSEVKLLDYMAYGMILISLLLFILLQLLNAPYGRYTNTSMWGFGIPVRVAWFVQALPSFLVPVLLAFCTGAQQIPKLPNIALLSMMMGHYFHRIFIFSLLIRGGKPTPAVPFLLVFVFCVYNGYLQGRTLTEYAVYSDEWTHEPRFLIGMCMFLSGMAINIHSDYILRNLRKPGETSYKIPSVEEERNLPLLPAGAPLDGFPKPSAGGMFNYVTGANFLGETIEWVGYAIACWNLQAFAFAFFTLCNTGPRSYHHHQYYLQKFDDYPKERKILIPFIL